MNELLKAHLDRHDGGCQRAGKELNRLVSRVGCSQEMLRSMYYGRRTMRDQAMVAKLRRAMAAKKAK